MLECGVRLDEELLMIVLKVKTVKKGIFDCTNSNTLIENNV